MSDTQDIVDFSRKSAPSAEYHYDPRTLFARQSQAGVAGQALLILNSPIKSDDVLRRLWKASDYVVCADGGANCLYEALGQAGDDSHSMREIFVSRARRSCCMLWSFLSLSAHSLGQAPSPRAGIQENERGRNAVKIWLRLLSVYPFDHNPRHELRGDPVKAESSMMPESLMLRISTGKSQARR